jgi:hypothetical protein
MFCIQRGGWQYAYTVHRFCLTFEGASPRSSGAGVVLFLRNQAFAAEVVMHLTAAHISPIVALVAGILILIAPRLLNYVVAIYLIVVGLVGLNGIYHFMK